MIVQLKGISKEGCLVNENVKIINANLKFLIKVPTHKVKINFYKNQIYVTNLKSYSNQYSDSA